MARKFPIVAVSLAFFRFHPSEVTKVASMTNRLRVVHYYGMMKPASEWQQGGPLETDYPRLRVYLGLDSLLIDERTQILFLC